MFMDASRLLHYVRNDEDFVRNDKGLLSNGKVFFCNDEEWVHDDKGILKTGVFFIMSDRRSDYSEARISQEILADSKITGGNFTILDRDVRLKRS